jgi:hypothetical protein
MTDYCEECMNLHDQLLQCEDSYKDMQKQRDWYKAMVEQMKSPDESCLEEREAGNGGCGACAICCGEWRERAVKAEREWDWYKAHCEEQRARAEKAEREHDELREQVEAWEYCARWVSEPGGEPLQTLHAGSITELAAKVRAMEEQDDE